MFDSMETLGFCAEGDTFELLEGPLWIDTLAMHRIYMKLCKYGWVVVAKGWATHLSSEGTAGLSIVALDPFTRDWTSCILLKALILVRI